MVHVAFRGTYRLGSQGNPDADYLAGLLHTIGELHSGSSLVLDLSGLRYEWGNRMDKVLVSPNSEPFAIVVGSECERGLSTLRFGVKTERSVVEESHFFRTFEEAVAYLRPIMVERWNNQLDRRPGIQSLAPFVTLAELD